MPGTLYIVSTPIGNLSDMTARAQKVLSEVEVVLAEDTRVSVRLLSHFNISKPLLSCHDFNEVRRLEVLSDIAARQASVALISDAGTPLISDPGYQIVRKAIELKMSIVPVPGASALLAALVGSGIPCDRFIFEGFLPDKAGDRKRRLEKMRFDERATVFYIAPSNAGTIVEEALSILGDRQACVARELTKLYEEFIRGNLSTIRDHLKANPPRGECVLVVAGAEPGSNRLTQGEASAKLQELLVAGTRLKDAASMLSGETGWSVSELYKLGLSLKDGEQSKP